MVSVGVLGVYGNRLLDLEETLQMPMPCHRVRHLGSRLSRRTRDGGEHGVWTEWSIHLPVASCYLVVLHLATSVLATSSDAPCYY